MNLTQNGRMPYNHDADLAYVRPLVGRIAADLDEGELEAFNRLCDAGLAYRSYEGIFGLFGVGTVRLR